VQVNARFAGAALLGLALGFPTQLVGADAQETGGTKGSVQMCWPGEHEIQNPNVRSRRPPRLPVELANEKVQRSVLSFRLCIADAGSVARVLVILSSGNKKIDKYYTTELSNWTFMPAERENRKVPSVLPVTVNLYLK
jgi:hypothetical protein